MGVAHRPKKCDPKHPCATKKELLKHAEDNKLSIAEVILAYEVAVTGKTDDQINAFLHKISGAMLAIVKSGVSVKEGVLPAPVKLPSKAATLFERAKDEEDDSDRAIALVAAGELAASEEKARGRLVISAPIGASVGVMPAILYALVEGKRTLPNEKVRQEQFAGATVGHLCTYDATQISAERGIRPKLAWPWPCGRVRRPGHRSLAPQGRWKRIPSSLNIFVAPEKPADSPDQKYNCVCNTKFHPLMPAL
jgi:L-serine dehydratase